MKLNRKGYTLIELLAVILIIGLILGFSTYGIINAFNTSKNKSLTISINSIKEAAETYATEKNDDSSYWLDITDKENKYFCITIEELMNKGLLDKKANIESKDFDIHSYVLVKKNKVTMVNSKAEILTKDKVNLRINFWVDYLITDLEKLVTTIGESYYDHLYNLVQMALRSVICDKTLDEILLEKEKISKDILSYLKSYESKYYVSFEDAGIKDIILPGEIKDILNTVLIAEKQAQANVITRREETASTRSLLNTAKLMEENDVLYRLKELEMLERIFDKVGNINVDGGNFIESLENIVGTRRKEK